MATKATIDRRSSREETDDIDQELIQDLGHRLASVWEYERYVAEATGRPEMQTVWRRILARKQQQFQQLKQVVNQRF